VSLVTITRRGSLFFFFFFFFYERLYKI